MYFLRRYLTKLAIIAFCIITQIEASKRMMEIVNNSHQTISFTDSQSRIHIVRPQSYCSSCVETELLFNWSVISAHHINWHYSALDPETPTIKFEDHGSHIICLSEPDCIDQFIRRISAYTAHFCDGLTLGLLTNSTEIMDIRNRRGSHICYGVGMFTTLYTIIRCIQRVGHAI